jgi:hypothetical protein
MVTLALRRVDLNAPRGENILDFIDRSRIHLLPNTAGCYTPEDAILTARLARELLGTEWIKLEVIGDPDTLFPCVEGTLEAARVLVKDGFVVLPYITDDPVACKRLADLGCAAVMPLAAPIGSGLGIRNPYNLRIILDQAKVPVIVENVVGAGGMIGVDAGSFWSQIQGGVDVWKDVGNGVIKSVVFGFTVTFVALLQGYEAQPTPEGVASATTRTVVVASLAVLALDFILTAMMFTI